MKKQIILLLLSFLMASTSVTHAKWIRVYDRSGVLIAKGHYSLVNDTAVKIVKQGKAIYVKPERIGLIITGRTDGHNMGVSALIGGALGMVAGMASADPDDFVSYSPGEGALLGMLLGGAAGAAFGYLTTVAKATEVFEIHGSMEALKIFQLAMKKKS